MPRKTRSPIDHLLTVSQAAEYAAVHPQTIRTWIRNGDLLCYRTVGGHCRIAQADLDKLLTPSR